MVAVALSTLKREPGRLPVSAATVLFRGAIHALAPVALLQRS